MSSHRQAKGIAAGELDNDLTRQIERLKKVSEEKYENNTPVIYQDIGSGLSFNRRGLTRLLNDVLSGKYDNNSVLLCSYRDRLARFGTELIIQICKHHNIQVIFTEKEMDASQEKELAEDVLAVICHFNARVHGSRAAKSLSRPIPAAAIERAKTLLDAGNSVWQIEEILAAEGFLTECNTHISDWLLRKHVLNNKLLKEVLPKREKTSIQEYIDLFVEKAEPHARISIRVIYDHYVAWCESKGEIPARINKLGQAIGKMGFEAVGTIGNSHAKGYGGFRIKGEQFHVYLKQFRKNTPLHQRMLQELNCQPASDKP